jgi:DNA-binding transcriptional MerR regulator
MENDLISKKELLDLTGISYGQLYRWKRKLLIPEEWFIRKSTFTGQETFFPRDMILSRIEKIKNMKDDASLDELAEMLSPNPADVNISGEALKSSDVVSTVAIALFDEITGKQDTFSFTSILHIYLLDKLLQSGEISGEEGKVLLKTLDENFSKLEGKNCDIIFIRKLGASSCILVSAPNQIFFDTSTKVAGHLNVASTIEELKTKLANAGIG